jgi:hypothetical protein
MRRLRKRDVPAGAAITIAALVLLASVVTGREESRAPETVAESVPEKPVVQEDLDLQRLKRVRKEGEIQDLFAGRSPNPPPAPVVAVAKPAPPPAPTAPPLPFKYLGRMVDGGKVVVFLERNQDNFAAAAGDTLDGTYRLESIGESAVQFVYLPLGEKQLLSIPAQY